MSKQAISELFDAVRDGKADEVRRMAELAPDLADAVVSGMTLLTWACQFGNPAVVFALLEAGANPNLPDEEAETPLHIAAHEGNALCVQLLLQRGAQADAQTVLGKTPLMSAAQVGALPVIDLLLTAGADPARADQMGRTALHWSAVGPHNNPAVAERLIAAGTPPGARTVQGLTAGDYIQRLGRNARPNEG